VVYFKFLYYYYKIITKEDAMYCDETTPEGTRVKETTTGKKGALVKGRAKACAMQRYRTRVM
jgi:hypothetical protein